MSEIDLDELREELLQCRRCGICRNAVYATQGFHGICPVWKNTSGFETSFMRGKIMVALALLNGQLKKTAKYGESLFQCTLCGNCTQICPAEFEPNKVLEQVRAVLVDIPNASRDRMTEKVKQNDNPYGELLEEKVGWLDKLPFQIPESAETLYFVGCTAALRNPKVAADTARILHAAEIDFAVQRNEPCCGSVLLRTGKRQDAIENAKRVAERISESGASRVVVSCAGCYKTLKSDYPKLGIELPQIIHVVELVDELIKDGVLLLQEHDPITVTYSDPCHLGREMGVFESPRNILRSIKGITLVEMETNREKAMCCGAGGGLRAFDGELAKRIAADRINEAEATGAKTVVTACPFCETNLKAGADQVGLDIDVFDIVEIVSRILPAD